MNAPLSAYVLSYNSEAYLATILSALNTCADEVLVVDSGSSDRSVALAIAAGARVLHRPFTDFRSQREFAARACAHDFIFFCDSDEIPDMELLAGIRQLKNTGFELSAYDVLREWTVLGQPVRVIYPVRSPDRLPRLFDRRHCHWEADKWVHETLTTPQPRGLLPGRLTHRTFETTQELERKLQRYTDLAAAAIVAQTRQRSDNIRWQALRNLIKAWGPSPLGALFKSYLVRGGWRDGRVGWILLGYAMRYSHLKHLKAARALQRGL